LNLAFRLYGSEGCPHCERAALFLQQSQVPVQFVLVSNDPIVSEGLKKIQGRESVSVPTLVCFTPDAAGKGEVVVGFREEDYKRVIENFRARASASSFTVSGAGGVD
jgi:glutaredoxin